MKIKSKTIYELSETDIKNIIAEYINKEKGVNITEKNVEINVGTETVGYGMSEHEEVCLKNIRVVVE